MSLPDIQLHLSRSFSWHVGLGYGTRSSPQMKTTVFTAPAYVRCEARLAVDPGTYMCTTAFIEYMNMSRNSTQDKQCMLYQESLSCYDRLANKKNLSCSHNQLHFYQLGAIDLSLYVNRPASQCNATLQPSGLDSCPGTIPEGDLCTNTERLRNLVFGVCLAGLDQMTSSELAGDQMKCRLYDSMLNCGVNVTHAFGNPCTVEQVERAVLEGNMSAIIQGLDPDICPVKPVRWHVELLFANETFTRDMADSSSDEFYDFVYRKYMHLMSVLFHQFDRYEVVNLRSEDELTLTVYVWSVETPYNMMYRNLVKEFAPDMRNIKIGPVYEDQDWKCSPAFIEKAKYDGCIHSYGKMLRADNDAEKCRHFIGFLTCIKFHALVNEEKCSVDDLVTMIRNETSIDFPSTCQYSDLKEQFPATREEVCTNTWIHHSIWEYVCLTFDLSEVRDPDNRCRTEINRRGCVLRTLQLANEGCSMDNVVRISQQPEFREGILDSVEPDCESRLPGDTACMKLFFMEEYQDSTESCFQPLYSLQRLAMLKSADEVNRIMTSNGRRSLKCSLFKETALCYLNILPSRLYNNKGVELNCTAHDIAPALLAATEINYDIQLQYLPMNTPAQQIFFDECEGNLTSERPVKECPSPSTVVDLVVGKCGAIVIGGLYSEGKPVNDSSCRMYDAFMECVHDLYLPNSELCPDDHIWMSLTEYSWYIRQQMAGLDPEQCRVDAACSDMDRIKRDYLPKCDQILEQLKTTTGDSPRCRLMKELFPCIVDNLAADNLKCWGEQLKREMLQGEILKDWGIGLDWPYYDVCEVDRCSAAFIERAIYDDCAASYYYMMSSMEDTQRCRRYLEFMGCIKYNALMNDDSCPVREIESLIRDSTSIGSSATYQDHLSQCQYPDLEDQLPKSKAEICNNTLIHHSIWEYACLPYNLSVVRDPDNRCSAEISRRGCVFGILREANKDCTMDNVVEVSQRPELRDSLLDSVEPDCDSKTPVCVKTFLEEAEAVGSGCFTPLFYLQSLTLYKSADEVNRMRSSDNNSSLKCSLFESVLQCYLSNGERNQNSKATYYNCTAADLAPSVTAATEIYYDILAPGLPPNTSLPQIQVDECAETLSSVEPIRGCPSLSYVADLVLGSCAARVIGGLQAFGLTSDNGTCLMYDSFVECVNQMYLPNAVLCPYGYVWKALREYSPYVRQQMAGFDPEQCRVEKTCFDMDLIKSTYLPECYHIFRDLTLTEYDQGKCRLFDEFVDCIIDTMAGDNLICNHDNLKRHMIDKNILSDWSEGFYWHYYDNCEETDKPGYCPVKLDREYLVGACAPQCQYDSDCDNRQKCCHVGCGLACFDPLGYNPYQMAIPVRLRASTLSLSSIYVQWYDPSLDDDQIIQDGRFYTVQYYNYEEGVITYINVTDHWVTIDGLKADTEYYFYVKSMNPPYLSGWSEEATNRTAGQPAKTSCEDDGYVLQVTIESCSQELESVQMYNSSSPDNCIAFTQLYQCIQKNMQSMWHYCDMDQLLSILERHSYLFLGLDISHCNGLVCTPLFLERARTGGKCSESLTQISEARSELENCRHYENLLGCIRYHSLINEEACNLTGEIETWIQDIVGNVTYCQACDYKWRVENNQGQLEAEVMIDLHVDKEDATITMRVNDFDPSSQWLAIGFSNNRFMAGSDIYTVQMMDNGEWMVRDRFTDGRAKPLPDDVEAAYLVYGYMENDTAIVRFLRPVDSGDLDRDLTLDTERYLQFARGPLGSDGDISYHSFRKTSDQMYNFYCDPYSNFENRLPSTKEEICSNPAVHHYMLEYKCLWYNINTTSDPSDRCRLELSLRGCVLGPLLEADIGCTLDDVNEMFQLPAVREGLLDSVRPRCEAYLTNDTECMKNFYTDLALKSEHCIDGLRRLQDYSYAPNFDINKIMSVTGERSLKCSFFEETLMCHMHAVQNVTLIDGEESICTANDYAPALTAIMHSYFVIYRAGDVGFNLSSCEGNLTEPTRDCPAPSRVVDLVMGNCGLQILLYQNLDPCSMLDFFMECAGQVNITNRELCPDDYMWASIVQYSDSISLQYAGFHPQKCRASQFCNNINMIREEFEPYCLSDQRKVLNNLYNTSSCQYFIQFVDCIHEKMEAQEISCNYVDIKEMLAQDIYGLSNWRWYYGDKCERVRWLVELQFSNETFELDMYNRSSEAARSFTKKYSNMVSVLVSKFGGGQMEYIYSQDGGVVMALTVWSVQRPDNLISMTLWSQFPADMVNISVVNTDEFYDQNRCLDTSFMVDIAMNYCTDELTGSHNSSDRCKVVPDLYICVNDRLQLEQHECNISTVIKQLTGEALIGAQNILPSDIDLDYCQGQRCSAWFIESAAQDQCYQSFSKLVNSSNMDSCRHYQEFLGCIKYHALINDEECPVAELDEMVQIIWRRQGLSMCIGYDEFESQFPDTKPEICNSSLVFHHLIEYVCVQFNYSLLPDPLDRCRSEYYLRGCLLNTLSRDAGCTMNDVERVIIRNEVRQGLLDSIPVEFCASNLTDSQCERDFYVTTSIQGEKCYQNIMMMYYLPLFLNVDDVMSADPARGKLKCSMFTEALRCFQEATDNNRSCSAADLAPALTKSLHITKQFLPTNFFGGNNSSELYVNWTECEANLSVDTPVAGCPSTSVGADIVMSRCAISVLAGAQWFQAEPCLMVDGFYDCMSNIALPGQCPGDYFNVSIEQHSSHIASVLDGFHPIRCKNIQNCSATLNSAAPTEDHPTGTTIDEKCFGPLNTLVYYYQFAYNMTDFEKCTVFETMLSDAGDCLSVHLPDYCGSSIEEIIQQRKSIYNLTGFDVNMCLEFQPDPCYLFNIVGFMKCGHYSYDSSGHYRYCSCFQTAAPAECNFTQEEIDMHAKDAAERFTGGMIIIDCSEDYRCVDSEYMKAEIMPKCQSDRELFYYNTSCESFDIFVNCVLEEMKNQQLECDPDVVKDRLADDYDRYLNYDEECKRIRWVSELTFNNETFVQEMYIVSSDAYRNFVQRYSYLISTLLRDFGGGLVKYLRQGSVIMALDYWSVGDPDSRIRRSLESQFSEAMGDIQLGFSYQDADQNKCTDSSYVMDVVSRNCSDELAALQSTSDVCKAFTEVYHCVSDQLRMQSHDCSLEIVLSHFLFLGQQNNGTTGLLPPGFDIDICKTEKCSAWFIEQAARGECMAPYARLNSTMTPFTTFNSSDEDSCRHYQEFLGCIKYHALINDEECLVAELDEMVKKMWGRPGLSMCIGYDEFESQFRDAKPEICNNFVIVHHLHDAGYDEFESQFPDTKPEICNSSMIVHHLLEYNCLQFNLSLLPDPLDRCRFEYFLRGCVLTSLEKDVGCSMDDVERVIKREEVRQGLLDSISLDYCAANLHDNQCELDVYSHNNDECFSDPVSLYYLDMFTKVEHLNSSDPNGGKLKCSIFTESLSCLMRSSDANNTCSAIDIAPAVRRSLLITRYLLPEAFPGANVSQTNISWTECDDLPDDSIVKSCPPSSVVVDMAVSRCAITVLYATRIFQVDPCMLLDGFKGCLASMVLPETCPDNYLQTSLEEYSTYIPSVMDGFDPLKCQYLGNCSQMLYSYTMENQSLSSTIEDRCFGPVNTFVYYFSSQVNFTHYEKCTVFQTLLSDVESCLLKHLPSYCESSIGDIVQQRQQIFMMYGFDMCTEYPPDECSMFGDVVFMRCHQNLVYDDNAGHCRLRNCYHEVTPAECNYTKTDIEYYSNDAYKKYTGYMLPNCTGDEHCFDLDYIESEIFPKCRGELEVFIDDRNCQNFDEFVNCVLEEMEKLEIKCDSDELKTRLAEEYYRYMTSYWDYSENCKRIRWVSEIRFNNETFVQNMYIAPSDEYRNFIQRYSYLISTLLSDFDGGQVKYLREGSVIMALGYWSTGDPESRIHRSLESRFSESMEDIELGYTYQDSDQNKCTDSSYVMDVISRNCSDELTTLQSTSDVCKAFTEVYHCVSDQLRMESHECSLDIVLSHFMGHNNDESSAVLPPEFDINSCRDEKCSSWFIEEAARRECIMSYARLNSPVEATCRHYQEFLGCIKYHALINDEECPVDELDEMVQKMWGKPGLSLCIDHDEFESQFPDTKPEICNSSVIVHHLLEYNCLQFNLSVLPDPLDRCRTEYYLRGCVLTSLEKDVGCSMDDVERVIKREEVRQGLLDSISLDYCAANLPDSQCELEYYSQNNEECLSAAVNLYYLDMFTKVDHLNSSDPNGGKLKCSIFTEGLSCWMRSADANNTCSVQDIAPAVRKSLQTFRYVLPNAYPGVNVSQTNISWTECDDIPEDSSVRSCPSTSVVVDMIISNCAIQVMYSIRVYQIEPCMMLDRFKYCLDSIVLPEICPENYLQTSLDEYSSYIPFVMYGFDPLKCQYIQNCSEMLKSYQPVEDESYTRTIEERCFDPVNTFVYYFSSQVNLTQYEKCTVFQTLLSDAENCVLKHLPNYCDSSVSDIMHERQHSLQMYGFDMCIEYPPDECSMFGDVVFMRCQNIGISYMAGHCRMKRCFQEVAPEKCNFTSSDIDNYASVAYEKYSGSRLPNCTDLDNCFSKVTPESEKCASAIMNITRLKDIQSIYPPSNFSYGQEEECGLLKILSQCIVKTEFEDDETCQSLTWPMVQRYIGDSGMMKTLSYPVEQCQGDSIDECQSVDLYVLLHCHRFLPYSCNFKRCVEENVSVFPQCSVSQEVGYPERLYNSFTGDNLPNCYGLTVPCDLSQCSDVMNATCTFFYCHCDQNTREEENRRLPLCI